MGRINAEMDALRAASHSPRTSAHSLNNDLGVPPCSAGFKTPLDPIESQVPANFGPIGPGSGITDRSPRPQLTQGSIGTPRDMAGRSPRPQLTQAGSNLSAVSVTFRRSPSPAPSRGRKPSPSPSQGSQDSDKSKRSQADAFQ